MVVKRRDREGTAPAVAHHVNGHPINRPMADSDITASLLGKFSTSFKQEDISIFVAGSNGQKHFATMNSDIDFVVVGNTTNSHASRLDLEKIGVMCACIRDASKELEQSGVYLAPFASFKTERFVESLVRKSIPDKKGKDPEQMNIKPVHCLFYPTPEAISFWENKTLGICLVSGSSHVFGLPDSKEKIISEMRSNHEIVLPPINAAIIGSEVAILESFVLLMTSSRLPKKVLKEQALDQTKFAALTITNAYLSLRHGIYVPTFKDAEDNAEKLPRDVQAFVGRIGEMRRTPKLPKFQEIIELHLLGAEALRAVERLEEAAAAN